MGAARKQPNHSCASRLAVNQPSRWLRRRANHQKRHVKCSCSPTAMVHFSRALSHVLELYFCAIQTTPSFIFSTYSLRSGVRCFRTVPPCSIYLGPTWFIGISFYQVVLTDAQTELCRALSICGRKVGMKRRFWSTPTPDRNDTLPHTTSHHRQCSATTPFGMQHNKAFGTDYQTK
ncbi:hypothetical protein BX600DRAFT_532064 [Xylariales sp. PMI_506]|nr:hypothetical protein BX600DRAFT_532064 [Xylariales sp. PMI_506]